MLIARAPMRISLFGGGTDLPSYYDRYGGFVVSTSINKYVYVIVSAHRLPSLQVISADYQSFFYHNQVQSDFFWDGNLDLPKRIFSNFGFRQGLNIFIASEVPPGTGLGSSSAVATACITTAAALRGVPVAAQQVAELASFTEIVQLGMPIGKQDQYASAYGGLNVITFQHQGCSVRSLKVAPDVLVQLRKSLMLFYTGTSRMSSVILTDQNEASKRDEGSVIAALHGIKAAAVRGCELLEVGDLDGVAALLDDVWGYKKQLSSGVSTPEIDQWYILAREHGALGGKITGAGGGGFLLLFCPPMYQAHLSDVLESAGLQRMGFDFECEGARVVLNTLPSDIDWPDPIVPMYLDMLDDRRHRTPYDRSGYNIAVR